MEEELRHVSGFAVRGPWLAHGTEEGGDPGEPAGTGLSEWAQQDEQN